MIRIVALIERYYHCKGFVYMRDGQDYKVMNETFREHFLLFLCVSGPNTDSGILKRRKFFDTFKGVTPKYALSKKVSI